MSLNASSNTTVCLYEDKYCNIPMLNNKNNGIIISNSDFCFNNLTAYKFNNISSYIIKKLNSNC